MPVRTQATLRRLPLGKRLPSPRVTGSKERPPGGKPAASGTSSLPFMEGLEPPWSQRGANSVPPASGPEQTLVSIYGVKGVRTWAPGCSSCILQPAFTVVCAYPVPCRIPLQPLNTLHMQMRKRRSKQVHVVTCSSSPPRKWGLWLTPSGVTRASA